MKLLDTFIRIPLADVQVDRAARQRRELFDKDGNFLDSDGLLASITQHGVISPILIDRQFKLIFGERRFTASVLVGHPDIPARFVEDLSPSEYEQLELVENLCRQELEWRDEVRAVARLHAINCQDAKLAGTLWSIDATAGQIGRSPSIVGRMLRVWKDFESPRIAPATSMQQAYNTLARLDERKEADELSTLVDATSELFDAPPRMPEGAIGVGPEGGGTPGNLAVGALPADGQGATAPIASGTPTAVLSSPPLAPAAPIPAVLHTSFLQWLESYSGPTFNLLHCDFPYGVNVFGGAWSGRNTWSTYDDKPDDYITLIRALCTNLDRILSPSCHVMFWTSANIRIQASTIELFRELAPSLIFNDFPLVWHKTDNVGIVPDPAREARRVVETCLYAARSDRKIVRTVSNAYGSPTQKDLHPSTKPEPMLRHFMQMFVDEGTQMLDPTCGSGSALRAAESLGAKRVLGLEVDEEYAKNASTAMRNFRNLRKVSK